MANKTEAAAHVVTERIARQILVIRGRKVMIDADLAALYGVPTKRLNEQVNEGRVIQDSTDWRARVPMATFEAVGH